MYQNKDSKQKMYDRFWDHGNVLKPTIWSLWDTIKDFRGKCNLEIGAGNCPRIPVKGGYFLDTSEEAIRNLEMAGGISVLGDVIALPFENNFFDLVAAFEILEHIENDEKAFSEMARILKPSGFFIFSVPLRQDLFNELDSFAGHKRRYEIARLKELLSKNGFKVLKYRAPSLYIKILNKLDSLFILIAFRNKKVKNSLETFTLPKVIFNLYYQIFSFLERKSAPKWQTDLKNLSEYEERRIVMFCQKCN
jgi:SAM-dependent methyltransferase